MKKIQINISFIMYLEMIIDFTSHEGLILKLYPTKSYAKVIISLMIEQDIIIPAELA